MPRLPWDQLSSERPDPPRPCTHTHTQIALLFWKWKTLKDTLKKKSVWFFFPQVSTRSQWVPQIQWFHLVAVCLPLLPPCHAKYCPSVRFQLTLFLLFWNPVSSCVSQLRHLHSHDTEIQLLWELLFWGFSADDFLMMFFCFSPLEWLLFAFTTVSVFCSGSGLVFFLLVREILCLVLLQVGFNPELLCSPPLCVCSVHSSPMCWQSQACCTSFIESSLCCVAKSRSADL